MGNTFAALVSPNVPPYLMSTVNEADAKKAYEAWLKFKDVVKANPITPKEIPTPAALSGKLGAIDAAASKVSLKPLPGVSANEALKAIDKALVMGASMDSKLLQDAAMAHSKALNNMDTNLVTTEADYTAVNAAIGKLVASVPQNQVMDVYNAFAKITSPVVPSNLFNMVDTGAANAAYDAFLNFKDVVKA